MLPEQECIFGAFALRYITDRFIPAKRQAGYGGKRDGASLRDRVCSGFLLPFGDAAPLLSLRGEQKGKEL